MTSIIDPSRCEGIEGVTIARPCHNVVEKAFNLRRRTEEMKTHDDIHIGFESNSNLFFHRFRLLHVLKQPQLIRRSLKRRRAKKTNSSRRTCNLYEVGEPVERNIITLRAAGVVRLLTYAASHYIQ